MKSVSPALAAHLNGEVTTLATCWRLERADGWVRGFTDHDRAPHHCAYVTPEGGLIHCYREAGRVVEQALTDWWRAKLRHAFRLLGIQEGGS